MIYQNNFFIQMCRVVLIVLKIICIIAIVLTVCGGVFLLFRHLTAEFAHSEYINYSFDFDGLKFTIPATKSVIYQYVLSLCPFIILVLTSLLFILGYLHNILNCATSSTPFTLDLAKNISKLGASCLLYSFLTPLTEAMHIWQSYNIISEAIPYTLRNTTLNLSFTDSSLILSLAIVFIGKCLEQALTFGNLQTKSDITYINKIMKRNKKE